MAFRFSLQTLLRVREIAEEREERLLTQILGQISSTRQELHTLEVQVQLLLERSERELASSIKAAQLRVTYGHMRALEGMQKDVTGQLTKLESLREQQMKIYAAARKNRELLSDLRESQLASFHYQQGRQEQALMDDNFSSRMRR